MNQSLHLIMKLINEVIHLLTTVDEISHFTLQLPAVRMRERFFLFLMAVRQADERLP